MRLKIGFVVAAAGLSRRHPPNKLLLEIDSIPVIRRTLHTFNSLPYQVVATVGHQAEQVEAAIGEPGNSHLKIVTNPDYHTGMASSLIAGINALPSDLDYLGFLPGDKPFIHAAVIDDMIEYLSAHTPLILVPQVVGISGHPTFFSNTLRSEFLSLAGDTGGREIITKYEEQTTIMALDEPGIIMDMDRWLEHKGE